MTEKSRRRWFQFGLRTMFVVVTVCAAFLGWLTWEWRYVHARKACMHKLLEGIHERGMRIGIMRDEDIKMNKGVPFWRRWLGDQAVPMLVYFPSSIPESEVEEIESLLPEVSVIWKGELR
ncbi:MAG TPA: hypothetical protein VGJ26_05955 [Pirellulales bacterium]|jgi:hypothetical protein